MRPRLTLLGALTLVVLFASSVAAGPVTYTFSGTSFDSKGRNVWPYLSPEEQSFVLQVPAFITATVPVTQVAAADLTSCSAGTGGVLIGCRLVTFPSATYLGVSYDAIHFSAWASATEYYFFYYYFAAGSLTTVGTHNALLLGSSPYYVDFFAAGSGTLTVSEAETAVPEPGTLSLLGGGLALGLSRLRRRRP